MFFPDAYARAHAHPRPRAYACGRTLAARSSRQSILGGGLSLQTPSSEERLRRTPITLLSSNPCSVTPTTPAHAARMSHSARAAAARTPPPAPGKHTPTPQTRERRTLGSVTPKVVVREIHVYEFYSSGFGSNGTKWDRLSRPQKHARRNQENIVQITGQFWRRSSGSYKKKNVTVQN